MINLLKEKTSLWQFLKETEKPIIIYGMGDGADKIINVLETFKIKVSGIFASDEFVRGHSFRGMKVKKLSEIEAEFEDFIILLSFATQREEVLEKIRELASRHTLFAPDVPVAGEGLFTPDFIKEHNAEFLKVYNSLCDETSKEVFLDTLNFKISGKIEYLLKNTTPREDIYKMLNLTDNEHFVDLGAYNGDTVREFLKATQNKYSRITAFEPDVRNFKKLSLFCENLENAVCHNIGAHSHNDVLTFASRGGRNSSLYKSGEEKKVAVDSVDNLCINPTVIKFDVEGNELLAIKGCEKSILEHKPKLLVSAYHRNEDLFSLPLEILKLRSDYKLYLRRETYMPAWEINYLFL